jgi:hypothetical protein
MKYDQITVIGEGSDARIVGWRDGATVARIIWNDHYPSSPSEFARECAREGEARGLLWIIEDSRSRGFRLVSAELVPRVRPEDLMAAIAPGNRGVLRVGASEPTERCMCADERLYTVTVTSPDGTTDTVGPMMPKTPFVADTVAWEKDRLRKEHPGAELNVGSRPNPNYRPDCLQVIAENAAYVKYVGPGGSGRNLYCQRCAVGI